MTKPMAKTQRAALAFLADRQTSGYTLRCNGLGNTGTLKHLWDRGYCEPVGAGHMAFPSNALWQITPAGRKALEETQAAHAAMLEANDITELKT